MSVYDDYSLLARCNPPNRGIRDELDRMFQELAECRAEIKRHHRDFVKWEEIADRGYALLEENKALKKQLDRSFDVV